MFRIILFVSFLNIICFSVLIFFSCLTWKSCQALRLPFTYFNDNLPGVLNFLHHLFRSSQINSFYFSITITAKYKKKNIKKQKTKTKQQTQFFETSITCTKSHVRKFEPLLTNELVLFLTLIKRFWPLTSSKKNDIFLRNLIRYC